jgi:Protein of unknown function (DUF2384)
MALWDIKGKSVGQPLAALLAARPRLNQWLASRPILDYCCRNVQYWIIPMATAVIRKAKASGDAADVSGPALRTFFRIATAWRLDTKEQLKLLGSPPRSTFYHWKQAKTVALPLDTLERLSYILGIYKALQILLPRPEAADAWIRKPNAAPLFGGHSALDRMLSGQVADLYLVRQYLDAQRGGWA